MRPNNQIAFICGDNRQIYLANMFLDDGWIVYTYNINSNILSNKCIKCANLESAVNNSNIIVFPFKIDSIPIENFYTLAPTLKEKIIFGGNIPTELINCFYKYRIKFYDFFKADYITRLNAIATAEGCIKEAISISPYNLHGSKSLVLGYGNCGNVLAFKLKNLDSKTTIACRNPYQGACAISVGINYIDLKSIPEHINNFRFIFNTIPSKILNKQLLDKVNPHATIIDIASSPGGIDLEYAKMINLNAVNIPGIPGKVSAISSAKILFDYIIDVIS